MKFGKRLLEISYPGWEGNYLAYKALKQILKQLGTNPIENARIEGQFLMELMTSVHQVNAFYMAKEAEQAQLLEELTQELAKPEDWIITPLDEPVTDQTLAMLAPKLCEDKHASAKHIAALMRFVHLCEDVDCLRKFSVLNYLAVTKIVKKHDKVSSLSLREAIMSFVGELTFYTSTSLATTFTHAQCLASEVVAAATGSDVVAQSADYSCCICFEVLNMPVVLSCAHRFCYGCLARACFYDHHCPLCKKETDLDPANYHIDPILTKFVDAHFVADKAELQSPEAERANGHADVNPACKHNLKAGSGQNGSATCNVCCNVSRKAGCESRCKAECEPYSPAKAAKVEQASQRADAPASNGDGGAAASAACSACATDPVTAPATAPATATAYATTLATPLALATACLLPNAQAHALGHAHAHALGHAHAYPFSPSRPAAQPLVTAQAKAPAHLRVPSPDNTPSRTDTHSPIDALSPTDTLSPRDRLSPSANISPARAHARPASVQLHQLLQSRTQHLQQAKLPPSLAREAAIGTSAAAAALAPAAAPAVAAPAPAGGVTACATTSSKRRAETTAAPVSNTAAAPAAATPQVAAEQDLQSGTKAFHSTAHINLNSTHRQMIDAFQLRIGQDQVLPFVNGLAPSDAAAALHVNTQSKQSGVTADAFPMLSNLTSDPTCMPLCWSFGRVVSPSLAPRANGDFPLPTDPVLGPPYKMQRINSFTHNGAGHNGNGTNGGKVLKKRACLECHRAKAACEGDPCWRCVRLGKKCVTIERTRRRRRSTSAANTVSSISSKVDDLDAELITELDPLRPVATEGLAELLSGAGGPGSLRPGPLLSVPNKSDIPIPQECETPNDDTESIHELMADAGAADDDLLFSLSANDLSALIAS